MSDFDRIRPRAAATPRRRNPMPVQRADVDGKRGLFSAQAPTSSVVSFGALQVSCSTCGTTTAMTAAQVLVAAVPSLHLPLLRRTYPSWMRCPACRRRTWVRISTSRG